MTSPPKARVEPVALRRLASDRIGRTEAPTRPVLGHLGTSIIRAFGSFPLATVHRLGTLAGALIASVPNDARRVTEVNVRIAFPDLSPNERARLVRSSLIESARTFAEVGAWWTWDAPAILRHVSDVDGEHLISDPLEKGRGAILAAPHLGSWELLGAYMSMRYPMTTLYRAPRNRELDVFFQSARRRFGAHLVPAGLGAARDLLRALRRGRLVGMLPDQDSGTGAGVFVPFFNEVANTMTLLSKLAHRAGAPVVIGWAERHPGTGRYTFRFSRASAEASHSDVAIAAAALNRDIERVVRTCPEQYLWSYRRFRIRPSGSPNPYDRS